VRREGETKRGDVSPITERECEAKGRWTDLLIAAALTAEMNLFEGDVSVAGNIALWGCCLRVCN
jgi:hypothetical protein